MVAATPEPISSRVCVNLEAASGRVSIDISIILSKPSRISEREYLSIILDTNPIAVTATTLFPATLSAVLATSCQEVEEPLLPFKEYISKRRAYMSVRSL